jgi:hypothetical protein
MVVDMSKPSGADLDRVDIGLIRAADKLKLARGEMFYANECAKKAALAALEVGVTEVAVTEALGVNRLTVRKWRGK